MAVASSLATTLSLVSLHQASFSAPAKSSFLSFSLLSPNLSLRLSRASLPRLYAAPDDFDQFEPEENTEKEDDSEFTPHADNFDQIMGDAGIDVDEGGGDEIPKDKSNFLEIEDKREVTTKSPPRKRSSSSAKRGGKTPANYQIRIKLKSYWVPRIEDACKQILEAARTTNAKTMGPVPLPTKKRVYCVLKSPHKHKDAREHFEIRTHQRLIDIIQPTAETVDSLMQIEFPAGVDVKVKV
jgi:ribosomal protein S10